MNNEEMIESLNAVIKSLKEQEEQVPPTEFVKTDSVFFFFPRRILNSENKKIWVWGYVENVSIYKYYFRDSMPETLTGFINWKYKYVI